MPEILKVNAHNSENNIITRAAEILTHGGIIAYPTETFYGLGADATDEKAIRKIFAIKSRNFNNPISVIIDQTAQLKSLAADVPDNALMLIKAFWPGALTIVFKAAAGVSSLLTADTSKIGIRISSHPTARAIAAKLQCPITATSANLSGAPECATANEVEKQIGNELDAIIDSGKTAGGLGSTIVDVTVRPAKIIRQGVIAAHAIKEYIDIK